MLHMYFAHTNQTLLRLNGPDYEPCQHNGTWDSIEIATNKVKSELTNLILELLKNEEKLPYIVEIYKFHKKNIGGFLIHLCQSISTLSLFSPSQLWHYLKKSKYGQTPLSKGYENFLGVETSIYWIIDIINDFTFNIPDMINKHLCC